MSLENVPSAVPDVLNFTKILPLAVESRARRRSFLPDNAQTFRSDQNNIIRIPVAANAFLDTKESYLRMRLLNTTGFTLGLDFGGGHGIIQRLTILQGGRILSDVHRYNRLLSAILLPAQGSETNVATRSVTEGMKYGNSGVGGAGNMGVSAALLETNGAIVNTATNADDVIPAAAGSFYNLSIPLVNGLLGSGQEKLVPLQLLGSQPIVIEITLAPAEDIGVWGGVGGGGFAAGGYTIDNVRYMASLVEVGQEVDAHLRQVQSAANGRLTLNGTDWSHYSQVIPTNSQGQQILNIPSRRKSIKSVLWVGQGTALGAMPAPTIVTNMSYGGHLELRSAQLKVGSNYVPPLPVRCDFFANQAARTRAEAFEELAKCFGSVHDPAGKGSLSRINWMINPGAVAAGPPAIPGQSPPGAASVSYQFGCMGIDCEAFQPDGKGGGALESGLDTATRSLPISLHLDVAVPIAEPVLVDMYVVYDSIYWIDQGGNLQVSM